MRNDIWIFLFFLGVIFFGWPFVGIFKSALPAYLFAVWIVFIILLFVASILSEREDGGE